MSAIGKEHQLAMSSAQVPWPCPVPRSSAQVQCPDPLPRLGVPTQTQPRPNSDPTQTQPRPNPDPAQTQPHTRGLLGGHTHKRFLGWPRTRDLLCGHTREFLCGHTRDPLRGHTRRLSSGDPQNMFFLMFRYGNGPFGDLNASPDVESRCGSPGDSGLVRRGHI